MLDANLCFQLLRYDPQSAKTVGQLPLSLVPEARPNINCFQALDYFQTGRSHLLLLTKNPGKASDQPPAGVVTLEGEMLHFLEASDTVLMFGLLIVECSPKMSLKKSSEKRSWMKRIVLSQT